MKDRIIAPSLLSCDFGRIAEEARAVEQAGADWIHLDVMDGRFVPNITFGPRVVEAVRRAVNIPLDVHLMIVEPEKYLKDFVEAGADVVTVHVEATTHLHRCMEALREYGRARKSGRPVKAGVAVNPHTPISSFSSILDQIDIVLIMTVNPGFGGQKLIRSAVRKIRELSTLAAAVNPDLLIEVDGGIDPGNIAEVAAEGAGVFVAGSAVFKHEDYSIPIRELHCRRA